MKSPLARAPRAGAAQSEAAAEAAKPVTTAGRRCAIAPERQPRMLHSAPLSTPLPRSCTAHAKAGARCVALPTRRGVAVDRPPGGGDQSTGSRRTIHNSSQKVLKGSRVGLRECYDERDELKLAIPGTSDVLLALKTERWKPRCAGQKGFLKLFGKQAMDVNLGFVSAVGPFFLPRSHT